MRLIIWKISRPRNIDILSVFVQKSGGDPSGKNKGSEQTEQVACQM